MKTEKITTDETRWIKTGLLGKNRITVSKQHIYYLFFNKIGFLQTDVM